jgi:predicted nucleic acid-binding protein
VIAADSSTWIAFLQGEPGEDTRLLEQALTDRQVLMIPVVLTELLSDPGLPAGVAETLAEVPLIEVEGGYWQRAGALRAKVLAKRRKVRLGDALVAQTCVDGGVTLITRDKDFRAFIESARLTLALYPSIRTRNTTISGALSRAGLFQKF